MGETILRQLSACESEKGVRILSAVESGSRCWGFEGQDSDYDVRFVYIRPKSEYLRLSRGRDTIEWLLDDDLDVVGWDVTKLLTLMGRSNPTTYEWMGSTTVYREEKCFEEVRKVAFECFDPVTHAHHYLGMAKKHDVRYLRAGKPTMKRYLYAVRSLLACRWAVERQKPVPMAFEELKGALLEPKMAPLVDEIVSEKRLGREKETCEPIPELESWIFAQEQALDAKIDSLGPKKAIDQAVLDETFLKLLCF